MQSHELGFFFPKKKKKMLFKEKSERTTYRPSEHPPVREGKCQNVQVRSKAANTKPFHGIKTDSPMEITLGRQYNVGEKPTVILYIYINRHAGTPEKQRSTPSHMVIIVIYYALHRL